MSGEWNTNSNNGPSGAGGNGGSPLEKVSRLADDFKKQASGVAEDVTLQVKEQASNLSEVAKDAASGAGKKLRSAAEDQKNAGADFVTGIAAALPSTPQEDKLLGPAADDLKQKAGDAALEGVVAVKEIATEMYQEAASRAKEQGLSVGDAKEFVGQIGEKIKTAATNVTGDKAGDLENSPRPLPARPASGRTT